MNRDIWINTRTGVEISSTARLGNPRAWLKRAWDADNKELELHETTHEPGEYSIGAVWYRPAELPHFDCDHIIRWFEAPAENNMWKRDPELIPVVGYAFVIPTANVMDTIKELKALNAAWLWWDFQRTPAERKVGGLRKSVKLDHNEIYELLSSGYSIAAIARRFDTSGSAVGYVAKKWRGEYKIRRPEIETGFNNEQERLYSICCAVIDGRDEAWICKEYKISHEELQETKNTFGIRKILDYEQTRANNFNVSNS